MNIPNKLTCVRLVLAPVIFAWFLLAGSLNPVLYVSVLVAFLVVSELTDLLDGKIARSRNMVTDLGKVMDPFADVICHLTYFTCFIIAGYMPFFCFIIVLWREFTQTFIRMLLVSKGQVMPANIFGKAKTCCYALCTFVGFAIECLGCFGLALDWLFDTMYIVCILCACAAVVSFAVYICNIKKSGVLASLTR